MAEGVGVIVERQGRVLLGLRCGSHGAGTWAPPGGALEGGEAPESCAVRELMEETGLRGSEPRIVAASVDSIEGTTWHTVFVACSARGEPELREPWRCERWGWFAWAELPEPLFAPLASLVAARSREATA